MIIGNTLRDRAISIRRTLVSQWTKAGRWTRDQSHAIIDLPRWAGAISVFDRAAAISWPRIAAISGFFLLLGLGIGGIFGLYADRPRPGPLPSQKELEVRTEALEAFKPTPPPGLVEANRSAPQSSLIELPR